MKTITSKILNLLFTTVVLLFTSGSFAADHYLPSQTFMLDGEYPHYGVIGDFNDDGIDDLAAVFPIRNNVTGAITSTRINFLVGNKAGTMKIETTFPLPFNVLSMATGDFNGDGNPDLAVAQDKANGISDPYCGTQQGMVIFFGLHNDIQPDLQFATCMLDTPPDELWTINANGDNLADLIVGNQLFLSTGDGSFTFGGSVPAAEKVIADINGDNNPDVFTDNQAVCGDGNGGMTTCSLPPNSPLVDTDQQGNIPYQTYKAVLPISQQASADLNGDGIDDLVGAAVTTLAYPILTSYRKCGWTTAVVNVYRPGAGRGRSRTGGSYSRRSRKFYTCWSSSYYTAGATLMTTTSFYPIPGLSALRISLLGTDGTVKQVMGPEIDGYIRRVQVTDVNGDGVLDVLADIARVDKTSNFLGRLWSDSDWKVFTGNGDGTFNLPEPTGLALSEEIPGDFNGDGLTDFSSYVTPFDTEHMLSVAFHNPPAAPATPVADTTPPSVAFTAPANAEIVSGNVQLAASANDDTGVANIKFEVAGTTIGQVSTAPYQLSWDTSNLTPGSYTLQALATDAAGNSSIATVTVTVEAPATASTTPSPSPTPTTAQPTGNQVEFSGTVTEVGADYFVIDGSIRVSIGAASVLKYQDGFGPIPKVGDPAEGKADAYSDGSYVAVKVDFG